MENFLKIFTILFCAFSIQTNGQANNFNTYYTPLWGLNHLSITPQGEVQLLMDKTSGAGFRSKYDYGSGLFHIRMKIPEKKTRGIVTSFYLTSAPDNQPLGNHFELDFEFLGTNGILQTNVFNNDGGNRQQKFRLWFDPSKDFHTYEILWNYRQIVFFVDSIPIRVFKNNNVHGVQYPWKSMHIEASIWIANWAGEVDWSQAPFLAHYQDFHFNACPAPVGGSVSGCAGSNYFWNLPANLYLNSSQITLMQNYRKSYMTYDYCSKPSTRKPECSFN